MLILFDIKGFLTPTLTPALFSAPQASRVLGRTGDPRINPEYSGLL